MALCAEGKFEKRDSLAIRVNVLLTLAEYVFFSSREKLIQYGEFKNLCLDNCTLPYYKFCV